MLGAIHRIPAEFVIQLDVLSVHSTHFERSLRRTLTVRNGSGAGHRCDRWQNLDEPTLNHDAWKNAIEAVCFALRATLILCDVDTSDKQQRWNLPYLIETAEQNGIGFPGDLLVKLDWMMKLSQRAEAQDITARHVLELRDVASAVIKHMVNLMPPEAALQPAD